MEKKRRSFIRRVPALLFLAAGVSVAVLATREDGREKLSQLGESLAKGVETLGTAFASARQFAGDYVQKVQSQNDISYPSSSPTYQHNGSIERKSDYAPVR